MGSKKKDEMYVCPYCGSEYTTAPEEWLGIINGRRPALCPDCKKTEYDKPPSVSNGEHERGDRGFNLKFFVIFIALSSFLVCLNRTLDVLTLKEDYLQIVYEIFLVVIISSLLSSGKMLKNIKYLAVWAVIFLIFLTGYSYRYELATVKEKITAELIPARGYKNSLESVSFPVSSDGHFYIIAEVNGTPIMFLADTGASHIVLAPKDARKLGIDLGDLDFDRLYETANGYVRGSSMRIADFSISDIHMEDIRASVNEAEMTNSLLGMTFFKRLKSYEVKNDVLTLYWDRKQN